MIFIADYDPDTDTVRWCGQQHEGRKAQRHPLWLFAVRCGEEDRLVRGRFLPQKYGATIYRLRDDIIRVAQ